AADKGVNLAGVQGTGPSGRITKDDVLSASSREAAAPVAGGAGGAAPATTTMPGTAGARGVRREKLTRLRQRIAERLVQATHTAAMLTTFNECDMTEVMRLRAAHKAEFEKAHGVGLGFMGF